MRNNNQIESTYQKTNIYEIQILNSHSLFNYN